MRKIHFAMGIAVLLCISITGYSQTFTLVKNINSGSASSGPANFANIDGQLWFSADDGVNGAEFWKSNGTDGSTVLFKDINPGAGSSNPTGFTKINGVVVFIANDGVNGAELWKTDGTVAGTVLLMDINAGAAGSNILNFTPCNGLVFFSATSASNGREVWKTDGTAAGTAQVKDIKTTTSPSFPQNNSYPFGFTALNNVLYFGAIDNTLNPGLFKSDGTSAGTTLVTYMPIAQMLNVNNTLMFSGNNDPARTLMKSDGTAAGTVQLKAAGGPIGALTDFNGVVYYFASLASSVDIWKSDGTVSGTVVVKNIPSTGAFSIGWFGVAANAVFFVAPTGANGSELWKTDGTAAGTVVVKDITPGSQSSGITNQVTVNNTLYFSANDGITGNEIWKSDGTEAGTVLVQDINTAGTSNPSPIFQIGSKLYVSAQDNINGIELWVADLGSPGPLPLTLLNVNAKLVGQNGVVSWKTTFEENTSHFEIERSTNNRQYSKVGTVASANTGGTHDYSFTDPQITTLGAPVVFYRLKMKDRDSRSTYSKTFAIDISSDQPVVMLYPTPVRESATVMIAVKRKENLTLSIVDMNGKLVQQKKIVVNEGSNLISIETDKLSAGNYTVMINGESTNTSTRLVKQ